MFFIWKTIREAAEIVGCSKSTVLKVKNEGIERKKGTGRKPLIDEKIGKKIEKMMRNKRGIGTRTVEKKLKINRRSIQKYLKKQPWGSTTYSKLCLA